ncbi:hypothetical protein N7536_012492 [Penicillium majusculum]|nr:hypothetical protein N7536_012492 [Penicillium majusculum]
METNGDSENHGSFIERPTSTVHEAAKGAFEALFALWAARDLNHPLIATGNASFQGTSNTEQAADSGWRPGYSTGGRETDWPTIAVEVVWTERRIQVEEDVKFWLTQSSGHVNVAVTVTVHNWGRISVEEWASRVPFLARESKLYLTQRRIQRPGNASDFVLGSQEMEFLAYRVWDTLFKGHHP